eukprot:gene18502-20357_t
MASTDNGNLEQEGIEAIWIEILVKYSKSLLACIIYRLPDSSKQLHQCLEEKLDDMITATMADNKGTIISEDMNCNYLDQSNHKVIKNILKVNGLKQVITEATRATSKRSTLINVILTTDEQRISNKTVIANSISDHDLRGVTRKVNCQKFKARKIHSRSFVKYNSNEFISNLRELPWENVKVNSAWYKFKQLSLSVIDKHAPYNEKTVRGRDCPALMHEVRGKINECDYLLQKARRSKRQKDWSAYQRARSSVKIQSGKAKRTITDNFSRKTSLGIGESLQSSKNVIGNTILKNHHTTEDRQNLQQVECVFEFKEVDLGDLLQILKNLKTSKSLKYDNIPGPFVKDGAEEIAVPLLHLINLSLRESFFPTSEKCAKITSINKSGELSSMDNYRPISILPVLSKVLEMVVHKQLYGYLEVKNLLSSSKFGFRPLRSTQHAVTYFSDFVRKNIDSGELTGAQCDAKFSWTSRIISSWKSTGKGILCKRLPKEELQKCESQVSSSANYSGHNDNDDDDHDNEVIVTMSRLSSKQRNSWIIGSGAIQHMTYQRGCLSDYVEFKNPATVNLGDDHVIIAHKKEYIT